MDGHDLREILQNFNCDSLSFRYIVVLLIHFQTWQICRSFAPWWCTNTQWEGWQWRTVMPSSPLSAWSLCTLAPSTCSTVLLPSSCSRRLAMSGGPGQRATRLHRDIRNSLSNWSAALPNYCYHHLLVVEPFSYVRGPIPLTEGTV